MKGKILGRSLLILLTVLLVQPVSGQIEDPVDWRFHKEQKEDGSYRLHFDAEIEEGWHLYSLELPEDAIPRPTEIQFEENERVEFLNDFQEEGVISDEDPASEGIVNFFDGKAKIHRDIRVKGEERTTLKGELEFMVCDDERCLPPKIVEFSYELDPSGDKKEEGKGSEAQNEGKEDGKEEDTGMLDPVDWTLEAVKSGEREYYLHLKARIDEGWHLYSTDLEEGDGPLPTVIRFEPGEDQELDGELKKEEPEEKYDENFQRDVRFYENEALFEQKIKVKEGASAGTARAIVEFMACDDKRCTAPKTVELEVELENAEEGEALLTGKEQKGASNKGSDTETDKEEKAAKSSSNNRDDRGLWTIFLICFAGGFVALLTPCVFPMIPLTVSFFTKQSRTRSKGISNAITYSLSIVVIYTGLGYLVTVLFGSDAMNAMSTNPWMNILFFLLILFFAISFLGGFDLNLPDSWVQRSDRIADKGGVIGIFFMAFTLTLVSFSCTAPIIGPLLVQAASHGGIGPVVGMGGFALALALPFGLFAGFPAWLNSLPQSGGWMNTVKVTLGFLELALAFKFLSNADLVVQAGLLKRELFIAIWIGIFGVMGLYLLGLFKTPHDGETQRLSVPRLLTATASIVFTLYLIPGLFGAPLNMLSGFPPPQFYSEWSLGNEEGKEGCPLGLDCYHDYEKGLAQAKEEDKPLLIDFTGWACVNCRKMEDNVWPKPQVYSKLKNEVVLVSLYVDERSELPEEEQKTVTVNGSKMKIRTVGNKWSHFQAKHYRTNTQPYYVLLDHNEEELVEPTGYEPDPNAFGAWLEKGISNFK